MGGSIVLDVEGAEMKEDMSVVRRTTTVPR
jgi:hypothetical protein